ncbi:MAG: type III-A CRISPR-associated RAMP protein Csm5 [Candidatus Ancillula sp.]|jgi:CRISPR/Cas system CSM-associated protein Csm5 (group 7 of RAMP superfamily)|nr:type III-A CRISPR-associated RAMP protein Csm5 [Candidatus Ancillula sp.]
MSTLIKNDFIKRYKLTLTTLGPVHVGSGVQANQKEFYQAGEQIFFPNVGALYLLLEDEQREQFEQAVMQGSEMDRSVKNSQVKAGQRLDEILRNIGAHDITPEKHASVFGLAFDVSTTAKKPVPARNSVAGRGRQKYLIPQAPGAANAPKQEKLNVVNRFIRDGFGDPYIPGSSLKGMLRTLLFEYFVIRKVTTDWSEDVKLDQGTESKLSKIFENIIVADSVALKNTDLMVCQKVDRSQKGENNGLPLFRECLKPGVVLEFDISVTEAQNKKTSEHAMKDGKWIANIANIAQVVYSERYSEYRSKFALASDDGAYTFLGAGAGFRSKTVVNSEKTMAETLENQFREIPFKKKQSEGAGIPLSYKVSLDKTGKLLEMGKCKIEVTELQ